MIFQLIDPVKSGGSASAALRLRSGAKQRRRALFKPYTWVRISGALTNFSVRQITKDILAKKESNLNPRELVNFIDLG
jgi:hypothetical protein